MEEKKFEEKLEKFEAQEEAKPAYEAKCELNRDVINDISAKIKDIEKRISNRKATIHQLRQEIVKGEVKGAQARTNQLRIKNNEGFNAIGEEKVKKFNARIRILETTCKPLKAKPEAKKDEAKVEQAAAPVP